MNISTTPRRWALAVMTFVCLFVAQSAQAQNCSDFNSFPPYPALPAPQVTAVTLTLDNTGNVPLTNAILNSLGFNIDAGCDYWLTGAPFGGPVRVGVINTNFTCAHIGTHTFMLQAGGIPNIGDDMGPGATIRMLQVTVVDNIPPTITCPVAQVRPAGGACTYTAMGAEFDWTSVGDNCATNITYSLSGATSGTGGSSLAGVVFGAGVTTVTWTVQDNAQPTPNSAQCSYTVTVNDVTPPTIMCPANVVHPNAPANASCQWPGAGLGVSNAMVNDNCASDAALLATLSNNITGPGDLNGYAFPLGLTNVTYTINDGVNPPVNCMFSVNVTDQTNPVVTCPTPANPYNTDPGVCQSTINGLSATTSDNCSVASLVWAQVGGPVLVMASANPANVSGSTFALGTTTIRYTVTDGAGLMHSCQFNVNVVDNQPPTITALAPSLVVYQNAFTVNNAPGTCSQTVSWYRPSILPCPAPAPPYDYTHCVTDNCPAPSFIIEELQPLMPDGLAYPLSPTYNPTFPAAADFFVDNGVTPYPYNNSNPLHRTTPVDANFPVGTIPPTTLRYRVTDNNGMSSTLTITVAVDESEFPDANCVAGTVTVPLDPFLNSALITPAIINNGSTDNCGIADMTTDNPATPLVNESIISCTNLGLNVVTLYVTDNANNTSTCNANVFIVDNTLPQIGCPSSFVVPAGVNCDTTVANLIFNLTTNFPPSPSTLEYYDNSADPCGLVFEYQVNGGGFNSLGTYTSAPVDLSAIVFSSGNNTVGLRATDDAGNIAVCNFTVNVQDQTPPYYIGGGPAAGDTIIANVPNIGSCSARAIWATPTFDDNCPGAVTIVSQSAFSNVTIFSADNGGVTPVTYVVKDVAGNLHAHTFYVKVTDNQAPVAKCKLTPTVVNLSAVAPGTAVVTPAMIDDLSTDNCGYSYVSGNTTYTCDSLGTRTYRLIIKDDANNRDTCFATVQVNDVTLPTFTCPMNMTVNANAMCQATISGTASATDNCSIVKYEYDLNPPMGVSFALLNNGATANLANLPALPLGVTTVTLQAFDASNNSRTCTFNVTVQDVTPPTFLGVPGPITVNSCAPIAVVNPTAIDNCGAASVTYLGETFSGTSCAFTLTRTWRATDLAGITATVTQVITVNDLTGPTFSAGYLPSGTVSINVSAPAACTGNYTLTALTNTDVLDNDFCNNGISGISYTATGFPAGNMTPSPAMGGTLYTLPINTFPIGTTTVTLTATDGCGNNSTKVINIVVNDNQPPIFKNAYAAAPAGRCGAVYTLPNTSNNCDQLFTWSRPILGDITDCGSFTVTEVIDNDNNPLTPNSVQQFINLLNPFGPVFPPASPNVVAQFPVGETTVTYTATQGSNVSTCSFVVKILDTQAPSITCPGNQNLSISSACAANITVPTYPPASITDNCLNNVTVTQTPAPGTLVSSVVPVQADTFFTVTLKATDNLPNNLMSAPCSFTITLIDSQSPVPLITSLPNIVSNCTKDTVVAPGATDCNGVSIDTIWGTPSVAVMMVLPPSYVGGPPSYVLNPGNYVITWSYTDPENNTTTQPQSVFITVDNTGPVAIAQPVTINLDNMGNGFVTAAQLDNGSFDQDGCGPVDVSIRTGISPNFVYVDTLDFDCSNLANMGVNAVVFAATDINGNVTTFAVNVTVKDVTPPAFTNPWTAGQQDTVIQACAPVPAITDFPQLAADQCDLVVTITPENNSGQTASGCGKYSYVINRKWTATDDSGNSVTRTQKIIVADTQAPVISAPDTLVANTAPNALVCNAAVNFNFANFVDDCQDSVDITITNTLISAPMGNMFVIPSGANISAANYPVGTYVVRFTATDACGNAATHDLTIQVKDVTPPTAVCINGVSASLQPSGTVTVTVNQFNNNSYDNCSSSLDLAIQRLDENPLAAPTFSLEYDCADADGTTQHPVKLFVADQYGNMSMCQTYIVIQDNVAPTIVCPPNKVVQCTDVLTPLIQGVATATDNCPIVADSISYSDVVGPGAGNICLVLVRTWQVIDLADNVSTCNQLLNIQDTIKPVLSAYPGDVVISCETPLPPPAAITATDNCSPNVTVEFQQDTINLAQGDCGLVSYTIVRTRIATDDCGNTEIHTRQIIVVDTIEPAFTGMPDSVLLRTSNFPPNLTCTVPWVFDAGQFLDDCAHDSLILVTNDGPFGDGKLNLSGNYPIGSYKIFFAAIDACGNVGIDSIFVEVIDDSAPLPVCIGNLVLPLGSNGEATVQPSDALTSLTDNCALDTVTLSQNLFDCSNLGAQTVVLTATDIYGNTNTCSLQVQVALGNNTGFNLTTTSTPVSYFGADNGSATAVATGGTGSFSFEWSTGDTTAVADSLVAGVYTVSVTDLNSGCVAVDTITIAEGAKITVNVGTNDGCQGETLVIPVTVDNFINVSGFNFGVALGNGLVGTITSLSDPTPLLAGFNLVPGATTVFWTDAQLMPNTLPNGTVLFNIQVTLSGTANVGTTSSLTQSAIPALLFLQDGTNQAPMVTFNNGSVSVSCLGNDLQVAGDVFTWKAPVKPVPGVDITLAGTVADTDVTALPNADYSFGVPSGANTTVSAAKVNAVKNNKINVGDMLTIQAHNALQVAFNSGYQWIAADIDGNQRINLVDYALVQKYVLGSGAHFTDNQGNQVSPDWKFVPEVFTFMPLPAGNPAPPMMNPLNNPVPPSTIQHNNVMMDFLDDDFTAVLVGDVNGDVLPSLTGGGGGAESNEAFKFRLDERSFQAGEIVTIPFKASDFVNRQAYQMTISFNPEVFELQDIVPGVLPGLSEANFGTANLADGLISTLWVGGKPTTFDDNEVLFSLTFQVLENAATLAEVLRSGSDITEALAIDETGNTMPIDFEYVASVATGEVASKTFVLYQNQPNPFTTETTISFRLPEAGRAALRVYSVEGRLVKTVLGDFAEGLNTITFRKDELGATGVFYYELESQKYSDRKKMILLD
jgi:hypothetical protein